MPLILNYPRTGEKDVTVGKLKIDVKSRQVFLPDGTDDLMYSPSPIKVARSILIYADATVDMELSLRGSVIYTSSLHPLWSRIREIEFDVIEIKTTKKTILYIAISNRADNVPEITVASYIEGNPYVYRGTAAVAGTAFDDISTVDVRADIGRNVQNGFIAHMGDAAGHLHVYEYDGDAWTSEYYTVVKDGVENLTRCNIAKLKIISSNATTPTFELNFR